MRFPPSFIERLRSHFLLSEIIGKRIPLKKHGREFQACCPFHNEKTPSFTVNDEKNFYHCFGCAAHGDAIGFLMKYDRLTYPEAIEKLARDAGIPMPEPTREEAQQYEREKTLGGVLETATQWFESQFANASGAHARDYVQRRGLTPETIRAFRIGYTPDDKTGLHQYLTKAGFSQALQAEAGLIIVTDQGSVYDRFRGRVIFPIRNPKGAVIAFGGRLLGASPVGKTLPKYLNSPETPLFKKGDMLYNLDLARRPAREGNMVVVMEGYMDVVSVAQSGVNYAVATLGTAVTPEHLRLLWQLAKEPVLCLDGDEAGKRAMMRAAEVALPLLKPGYSLRFALLPKGEDPDSYVQKHGRASFEKILINARRLSQTMWETLLPQFRLDLPEGRAALDDACKKIAFTIADTTVRQHYLSYFKKQLWPTKTENTGKFDKNGKQAKPANQRSAHVERMVVSHHSAALDSLVQRLLKTIFHFPALLHKSQVEETLSRLDIRNALYDGLRNTMLSAIGHANIDEREAFAIYVQEQLPGENIAVLLGTATVTPYRETLSLEDASQLWVEMLSAYEVAHLQLELKEVEESMGQSMDEASLLRMVELQQAIKRAHAGRSFAPVESDVA